MVEVKISFRFDGKNQEPEFILSGQMGRSLSVSYVKHYINIMYTIKYYLCLKTSLYAIVKERARSISLKIAAERERERRGEK